MGRRVILDENGAERLLGQGDMLYLPPSASRLIRAQGVLVTDNEIHGVVEFVSKQSPPAFDTAMHEELQSTSAPEEEVTAEDEELVEKCIEIIRQEKRASTSLLHADYDWVTPARRESLIFWSSAVFWVPAKAPNRARFWSISMPPFSRLFRS